MTSNISLYTEDPHEWKRLEIEHRIAFHDLVDVRNAEEQDGFYVLNGGENEEIKKQTKNKP